MKKSKKSTIVSLTNQLTEIQDKWKRALADYHNLEKRIASQQSQFVKLANAGLIDKLLSVLDNLETAQDHIKDKGLSLALTQFKDVFKSEGVEEIKAKGEKFDPEIMDCTDMTSGKKNIITKVTQKGYKLNSTVIRPAKVEVGSGTKK